MCQKKQASTKITCPKNLAGAEIRTRDILAGNVLTLPSVSLQLKWPPSDLTHDWAQRVGAVSLQPHDTRAVMVQIYAPLFLKQGKQLSRSSLFKKGNAVILII